MNDPKLLQACFERAIHLIWYGPSDKTVLDVKQKLETEFGKDVVQATLAFYGPSPKPVEDSTPSARLPSKPNE